MAADEITWIKAEAPTQAIKVYIDGVDEPLDAHVFHDAHGDVAIGVIDAGLSSRSAVSKRKLLGTLAAEGPKRSGELIDELTERSEAREGDPLVGRLTELARLIDTLVADGTLEIRSRPEGDIVAVSGDPRLG
ncbi:MAG TPA: hypothetical protein VGO60_13510 [Iamia sp.]|nr:hypothetical protein [Iamia sp.]